MEWQRTRNCSIIVIICTYYHYWFVSKSEQSANVQCFIVSTHILCIIWDTLHKGFWSSCKAIPVESRNKNMSCSLSVVNILIFHWVMAENDSQKPAGSYTAHRVVLGLQLHSKSFIFFPEDLSRPTNFQLIFLVCEKLKYCYLLQCVYGYVSGWGDRWVVEYSSRAGTLKLFNRNCNTLRVFSLQPLNTVEHSILMLT